MQLCHRPSGIIKNQSFSRSVTYHGRLAQASPLLLCRATEDGQGTTKAASNAEAIDWAQLAFPYYGKQAPKNNTESCTDFDYAFRDAQSIWQAVRAEAQCDAAEEPLLSSFLYASILAHDTFERALAFVMSNRLASTVMLPTQLFEIFYDVLTGHPEVQEGALADVVACRERDPACRGYSQALLYYKGYHALQTQRIAHALWCRGQRVMALALQSRMSEVLAVDIHPAARLGRGIMLDHGTGVVIGETCVIGNGVAIGQNVTLGGTGKETGDRHPKISDNVLIGANATVLGNIVVGRGAQVAAGSLVLKPVPPHTMVAGSPAKPVGKLSGNPTTGMQQWTSDLTPGHKFCSRKGGAGAFTAGHEDADADEDEEVDEDVLNVLMGEKGPSAATSSAVLRPRNPHEDDLEYAI